MRILFDLFTPQDFVGGAGEYVRRVFYTLLDVVRGEKLDVEIVAMVDSSFANGRFAYTDLCPENLRRIGVEVADIKDKTLAEVLALYRIDKVFIGAAQYWGERFDLSGLNCPVMCVVHDLCDEEFADSHVEDALRLNSILALLKAKVRSYLRGLKHPNRGVKRMLPIMEQARRNSSFRIVTVSNYTKNCLAYHFGYDPGRVDVLFSPHRVNRTEEKIENASLDALVRSGQKYYLMLSANRVSKNAEKALRAFERFAEIDSKQSVFVTVGYPQSRFPRHMVLPYLCEGDLAFAMKHCYALVFPSIFEGFGYPPVEAMSYGKPVLAANVTSIPEVLGDAPIYFSPFYESDIYRALSVLNDENYEGYVSKSVARSAEVGHRQQADLKQLISLLVDSSCC